MKITWNFIRISFPFLTFFGYMDFPQHFFYLNIII